MNELLNNLMHSELLHVELIALAFILLVLVLGLVFGYNIRKFSYPAFLVLIIFPLIWFGIKWIINLIGEVNYWVWIGIASIAIVIVIAKYWPEKWKSSGSSSRLVSFDKNGRMVAPATKERPWGILFFLSGMVMVIVLCLITMIAKGWKLYDVDNPPVVVNVVSQSSPAYYEQIDLGKDNRNRFSAGIAKSLWIKPNTSYHTIPQKVNDTIMLTWNGPSGSWSYLVWKDTPGGEAQYQSIKSQPNEVDGKHTVVADKDCVILWKPVPKKIK
jgi:hypothetical protein